MEKVEKNENTENNNENNEVPLEDENEPVDEELQKQMKNVKIDENIFFK